MNRKSYDKCRVEIAQDEACQRQVYSKTSFEIRGQGQNWLQQELKFNSIVIQSYVFIMKSYILLIMKACKKPVQIHLKFTKLSKWVSTV